MLHPRTLLADLADHRGSGADRLITELAWREFYADVLHHHPGSLNADLRGGLTGVAYEALARHQTARQRQSSDD